MSCVSCTSCARQFQEHCFQLRILALPSNSRGFVLGIGLSLLFLKFCASKRNVASQLFTWACFQRLHCVLVFHREKRLGCLEWILLTVTVFLPRSQPIGFVLPHLNILELLISVLWKLCFSCSRIANCFINHDGIQAHVIW